MADSDKVLFEVQLTDTQAKGDKGLAIPGAPSGDDSLGPSTPSGLEQALAELIQELRQQGRGTSGTGHSAPPVLGDPSNPSAAPPVTKPPVVKPPIMADYDIPEVEQAKPQFTRELTAIISSGITSVTGSPTLGSLGGIAVGALPSGALAGLGAGAIAAMIVSEINNGISESFAKGTANAANFISSPQRVDAASSLLDMAAQASTHLDQAQRIFGLNLNPLDDMFRGLLNSGQLLINNFDDLAQSMTEFSGPVAMASAEREVARIRTELYRAQQIGPDMADYIRLRTRASEDIERLRIDLQRLILPVINAGLTRLVELTEFLTDLGDRLLDKEFLANWIESLNPITRGLIAPLVGNLDELVKLLRAKETPPEDFMEEVKAFLNPYTMFGDDLPDIGPKESRPTRPAGLPGGW